MFARLLARIFLVMVFGLMAASPVSAQPTVPVRVTVHGRKPLIDAYVSLTAADRPWWRPSVEAIVPAGLTTLNIPPGVYRAFVGANDCQDVVRLVRVTPATRELRFDLEPEIPVSGVVLDEQGQPLVQARVREARLLGPTRLRGISDLAFRYFAPRWSTRTDTHGRWTLPANGEGNLALLIEAPAYAPAFTWLTASQGNRQTILKKGASLRVSLDRADSDVALTLLRDATPGSDIPTDWQTIVWSRSADLKTVEWASLPAGTYHIVARYPDPRRFAHAVSLGAATLAQGQAVTNTVDLPSEPRVETDVMKLFVPDKTTLDLSGAIAHTDGVAGANPVRLATEAVSGGVVLYLNAKAAPSEVAVVTPAYLIAASELTETEAVDAAFQTFISARADASLVVAMQETTASLPRSAVARFYDCTSDQRFMVVTDVEHSGEVKLPYPTACRSVVLEAAPYEPLFIEANLRAKETKSLGTFALRPGAIAEIHALRDPGGQDAAGAIIRVLAVGAIEPIVVASGTADNAGRLRLRALPADRDLIVEARDPMENLTGSSPVELEPGAVTSMDPLLIPLPARVTIAARLAPEFRERFPESKIQAVLIEREGDADQKSRRVAAFGKDPIRFDRLSPGKWHPSVLIEASGSPQPIPFDDLDLRAGEERHVDVEIRPLIFSGTIFAGGKGVRATLGFKEPPGMVTITRFATSGEDGRFTVMLPRSEVYTVTAARSANEYVTLGEFQLEEEQPLRLTFPEATLVVRVDDGDKPVADAKMTATLHLSSMRGGVLDVVRTAQTDNNGEAAFDALLGGRWVIEARHPSVALKAETGIDLQTGDHKKAELHLMSPLSLQGFVHDSADAPVPAARIDCIFVAPGNVPQAVRGDTDAEGHFALELSSSMPTRLNCGVTTSWGAVAAFITGPTNSADFKLPSETTTLVIPDWPSERRQERYWLVADDGRMMNLAWASSKLRSAWKPLYLPRIPVGSWKLVRAENLDEWMRLFTVGGNALSPLTKFQAQSGKAETVALSTLPR